MARAPEDPLAWSDTQAHILTGGGAIDSFKAFAPEELPHHHKSRGTCLEAFEQWRDEGSPLLSGCWRRPLFMGGWKESTEEDTAVFNVQTRGLFVDLRFPTHPRPRRPLAQLGPADLRLLARQHCFAGFSRSLGDVCTRHHYIDWNFHPEFPRPKPNKWRWELSPSGHSFKEFGVAEDAHGQAIYMERWERRGPAPERQVALVADGGIFVVAGDWFAVALDRPACPAARGAKGGCAALVDACADYAPDEARALLQLEGSCGTVQGWRIEKSTFPWTETTCLFADPPVPCAAHLGLFAWRGKTWRLFDSTLPVEAARSLFVPSAL